MADVTKRENGQDFSASAFAYVPVPFRPSTWKLRLEETPGKVTVAQLGRAAAAFSSGGFRGQKVEIPEGDVAKIKARIRAAYARLKVKPEDIPESVRESASSIAPLTQEARVCETSVVEALGAARADGDFPVVILSPGPTVDGKRHYTQEALRDAVDRHVFEGLPMYWGHEDPTRTGRRGHREMSERVGLVREGSVQQDEQGRVVGMAHVYAGHAKEALADDVARPHTGISWVGHVAYRRRQQDGHDVQAVQQVRTAESVDFVPRGNAGGYVRECAQEEADMTQEELLAAIAEALAPLSARLDAIVKQDEPKAEPVAEGAPDPRVSKLETELAELRAENARGKVERLVREAVDARSDLTPAMKAKVVERLVAEGVELPQVAARVEAVCVSELAYVTEAVREVGLGRTRVTGNGGGAPPPVTDFKAEAARRGVALPELPK